MKRVRGIFVTGTDTGVGKTVVACALAAWCRRQGLDVGVMKPVATGGRRLEGRWVSDDAVRLARAAGTDDPWTLVNPVCFREPLAPWTAALRRRAPIRVARILEAFQTLGKRHEFLVVEGVGGLLVPLTARTTVADLAVRLRLPVLLVARPGLGTLNHTLLSLQCLRNKRLRLIGILMNQSEPPPAGAMSRLASRTNPEILRRIARAPMLGRLPFQRAWGNGGLANARLDDWFARAADPQRLLRAAMKGTVDSAKRLW